jgi:hypothetical protein
MVISGPLLPPLPHHSEEGEKESQMSSLDAVPIF